MSEEERKIIDFPSIIFLNREIEQIKYSITSKYNATVQSGILSI